MSWRSCQGCTCEAGTLTLLSLLHTATASPRSVPSRSHHRVVQPSISSITHAHRQATLHSSLVRPAAALMIYKRGTRTGQAASAAVRYGRVPAPRPLNTVRKNQPSEAGRRMHSIECPAAAARARAVHLRFGGREGVTCLSVSVSALGRKERSVPIPVPCMGGSNQSHLKKARFWQGRKEGREGRYCAILYYTIPCMGKRYAR